jgi:hypothetical protein
MVRPMRAAIVKVRLLSRIRADSIGIFDEIFSDSSGYCFGLYRASFDRGTSLPLLDMV